MFRGTRKNPYETQVTIDALLYISLSTYTQISVFSMIIDSVDESDTLVEELIGGGISAHQTEFTKDLVTCGVQQLVENVVVSLGGALMDDSILLQ